MAREANTGDDDRPLVIERHEEVLRASTVDPEVGRVRLSKEVSEEEAKLEVTLAQDEVAIHRRPADRPLGDERPVTTRGETTTVLVVEERLEVRKVAWVVEEIEIVRGLRREVATVSDTVRKERVNVDLEGDVAQLSPAEDRQEE